MTLLYIRTPRPANALKRPYGGTRDYTLGPGHSVSLTKTCTAALCPRMEYAKGLCKKHYAWVNDHGNSLDPKVCPTCTKQFPASMRKYCSEPCMRRASSPVPPPGTCLECGGVSVRNRRMFCSQSCRDKAARKRKIGRPGARERERERDRKRYARANPGVKGYGPRSILGERGRSG